MTGELRKAVILARGLGTRMRRAEPSAQLADDQARAADRGMKAMIPFRRPFLDYVLSGLADAGFREVCLVIGPEHTAVREHYGARPPQRMTLTYAIQPEPRGTADAVLAAEPFAGRDEFAVMNSDNYYPVEVLRTLREMDGPGTVLFDRELLVRHSNIPAERVRAFAYVEVCGGELARVMEKPSAEEPISAGALVSMNLWRFPPEIFEHCRQVERSPRGEFELPAAVNRAVQHGMCLSVARSGLGVLDLSERADVAGVAERLAQVEVTL